MPSKPFYLITRGILLAALLVHGFTIFLEKYPTDHERSDAAPTFDLANLTPAQKQAWAAQQMWAAQQPPLVAFDLEARDDVKIVLATSEMAPKPKPAANWSFTFEPPASESVAKFRPILEDEWRHLPASLVKKCGLRRIILCSELEFNGQNVGGFASDNFDLYFNLSLSTIQDSPYVRRMIHHEFFHAVDFAIHGQVVVDPFWLRLNSEGFDYDWSIKPRHLDASLGVPGNAPPGFINRYCTSGVEEDKAEMFAYMVVNGKQMEQWGKTDAIIEAKRKQMMKIVEDFCPDMNDDFWARMKQIPRQMG